MYRSIVRDSVHIQYNCSEQWWAEMLGVHRTTRRFWLQRSNLIPGYDWREQDTLRTTKSSTCPSRTVVFWEHVTSLLSHVCVYRNDSSSVPSENGRKWTRLSVKNDSPGYCISCVQWRWVSRTNKKKKIRSTVSSDGEAVEYLKVKRFVPSRITGCYVRFSGRSLLWELTWQCWAGVAFEFRKIRWSRECVFPPEIAFHERATSEERPRDGETMTGRQGRGDREKEKYEDTEVERESTTVPTSRNAKITQIKLGIYPHGLWMHSPHPLLRNTPSNCNSENICTQYNTPYIPRYPPSTSDKSAVFARTGAPK